MRTSEDISKVVTALCAARPMFGEIIKSFTVDTGSYKFSYAPFPEIIDKTEQGLHHNDLFVVQSDDAGKMISRLCHSSGQWIENFTSVEYGGKNAQAYGAALTYARRYGYMQLLGLCPEDDDESRLEGGSDTTVTEVNRFPPKNSNDPNWQGPLNKTKLSDASAEFIEQVSNAGSEQDLDILRDSPEFKTFVEQASHDCPGLLEGRRIFGEFIPGLKHDFAQKRKELKQVAELEAPK